jgi:hypothetical protein
MQALRHATLPLLLLGLAWIAPAARAREAELTPEAAASSPGLEAVRRVSDPETRASLLIDTIETCPAGRCLASPEALLDDGQRPCSW